MEGQSLLVTLWVSSVLRSGTHALPGACNVCVFLFYHRAGASGSRITAHLVHEMRRRSASWAIGSACIGGGQGVALLLRKV